MNRRELFKGLGAVLVAASLPIPIIAFESVSDTQALAYLRRVRKDVIYKIMYPLCTMDKFGKITIMDIKPMEECLTYVNKCIAELEHV